MIKTLTIGRKPPARRRSSASSAPSSRTTRRARSSTRWWASSRSPTPRCTRAASRDATRLLGEQRSPRLLVVDICRRRAAAVGRERAGRGLRARRDRDRDRRPQRCRPVPRPDQQRRQRLSGQADHAGAAPEVAAERASRAPARAGRAIGAAGWSPSPARAAASAPRCSRPASPGPSPTGAAAGWRWSISTCSSAPSPWRSISSRRPGLREALEHPGRIDAPVRRPGDGPPVGHALRAQRRGVAGRAGGRRHVVARHPAQGAAQQVPLCRGRRAAAGVAGDPARAAERDQPRPGHRSVAGRHARHAAAAHACCRRPTRPARSPSWPTVSASTATARSRARSSRPPSAGRSTS